MPTFVNFVFNGHKEKPSFNVSNQNVNTCFFVSRKLHVCLKPGRFSPKKSRRGKRTDRKAVLQLWVAWDSIIGSPVGFLN